MVDLARRLVQLADRAMLIDAEAVAHTATLDDQTLADVQSMGRKNAIIKAGEQVKLYHGMTYQVWGALYTEFSTWNERTRDQVERALVYFERACWTLHSRVRTILPTDPSEQHLYAKTMATSWCMCMSAYLLQPSLRANREDPVDVYQRAPMLLGKRATDFAIANHLLTRQQTSVAYTDGSIQTFSVADWKFSSDLAAEVLWRYGWTPSTADFIDAHAMRYALWLVWDPEEEEAAMKKMTPFEAAALYNQSVYCTPPRPETTLRLPLNPRFNTDFVFHAEKAVFFALRHNRSCRAFFTHAKRRPMPTALLNTSTWRESMLNACVSFIRAFSRESFMSNEAKEIVSGLLLRRQLMPGEAEVAMYENGSLLGTEIDAQTILFDMRREELARLQRDVQVLDTHMHVEQWVTALLPVVRQQSSSLDTEWEAIAAARPGNERTALLVLETALDIYFKAQRVPDTVCSFARFSYCDDAGLFPPKDAPPETPEASCKSIVHTLMSLPGFKPETLKGGTPTFIAMAHLYAVIVPQPEKVKDVQSLYVTPHLPDALGCWLAHAVWRKRIQLHQVPPALRPTLDAFASCFI